MALIFINCCEGKKLYRNLYHNFHCLYGGCGTERWRMEVPNSVACVFQGVATDFSTYLSICGIFCVRSFSSIRCGDIINPWLFYKRNAFTLFKRCREKWAERRKLTEKKFSMDPNGCLSAQTHNCKVLTFCQSNCRTSFVLQIKAQQCSEQNSHFYRGQLETHSGSHQSQTAVFSLKYKIN